MNRLRKKNFVDSTVQGALLRRIVFHWLAFFVVTAISVIMLQALLGDPGMTLGERVKHQVGEFTLIGVVLFCLFPVFLLDTVRFSNRFVGPIGRLRRHMKQLGTEQNTDHCAFRGDDFWSEAATEFNAIADLVKEQKEEIARLKTSLGKSGVSTRG
jgi:signal transduction histidine kinase